MNAFMILKLTHYSCSCYCQLVLGVGCRLNIFACKSIIKEEEVQMCVCVSLYVCRMCRVRQKESTTGHIRIRPTQHQNSLSQLVFKEAFFLIFFLHYTTSYWNKQQWNFVKLSPTRQRIFTALWKTLHSAAACANHSLVQIFELNSDISYHESNAEQYMHHYCHTKVSYIINNVKARLPRPFPHPTSFLAQVCVQAKIKWIRW